MFLNLVVAGHSTRVVTRADGWSGQRPLTPPLPFGATIGTAVLGTLSAFYDGFVTPIGWTDALSVWAYGLVRFLFSDRVNAAAQGILRRRGVFL